jgi:PAS domain-containing protein
MAERRVVVRGTEIVSSDDARVRRQKLARITFDSMIQFVGLLDAHGTVIEINAVALDGVGVKLSDVEGRSFWHTFWWQVSPEINAELRAMIARAGAGELVRWDTEIYGRSRAGRPRHRSDHRQESRRAARRHRLRPQRRARHRHGDRGPLAGIG